MKAYVLLEDGLLMQGEGFGASQDVICELVFNTAMTGYVELLTDPSYCGHGVVMTYPLIGNYGLCSADCEAKKPWISAFIVHELSRLASNFRQDTTLEAYLAYHGVPGVQGVDTRALTRRLRVQGSMRGLITRNAENVQGEGLQRSLEALHAHTFTHPVAIVSQQTQDFSKGDGPKIALLDCGAKKSIGKSLMQRGARVKSYRFDAAFESIMADKPDGVMLSNGPGDPIECKEAIATIKRLYNSKIPIMAICLGHQLLSLANGATTRKMLWGHRGANHPVRDLPTGRVAITAQNHGYVVDTVPSCAEISHVNVNDGSIEGLYYHGGKVISVQFHPEGAAGPHDTQYLFDQFMNIIQTS